jgi:hypothetical protein
MRAKMIERISGGNRAMVTCPIVVEALEERRWKMAIGRRKWAEMEFRTRLSLFILWKPLTSNVPIVNFSSHKGILKELTGKRDMGIL